MSTEVKREIGRIAAGMYLDSQQMRIAAMNRVRDVIRRKVEGIPTDHPEEKKDREVEGYAKEYTDAQLKGTLERCKEQELLSEEEYKYIGSMLSIKDEAEKVNEKFKKLMEQYVQDEKVYTEFLQHIRGISTVISTKLIKNFGNCEKSRYISSLWSLCGYGVVDGHAPKRKKGEKTTYNPELRSFIYVIGDSFIKQRTPYYRNVYDLEKERQLKLMERQVEGCATSRLHAELRARRKMVKRFLSHYWAAARELNGLPVSDPFPIAKLGHDPADIQTWRDALKANLNAKEEKESKPKVVKDKIKA